MDNAVADRRPKGPTLSSGLMTPFSMGLWLAQFEAGEQEKEHRLIVAQGYPHNTLRYTPHWDVRTLGTSRYKGSTISCLVLRKPIDCKSPVKSQ